MKQTTLVELSQNEKRDINGGNVPISWYMDSSSISANAKVIDAYGSFWGGLIAGLLGF
ncbi:MAG: hypothetical protein AB1777_11305 [Bacteroidota bacterium]